MTQDISSLIGATHHSHIVTLRTEGAGSPLFCFPGSDGIIDVFREMAAALPEGSPVYAIQMEWMSKAEHEFTIEQLAPFYLDVIRKIQKSGPYHFCGYSFGGLLIYEMAMRLCDEGDDANLVAMLDAPNPAFLSNLSGIDAVQFHKTLLIDRLKKYRRMIGQFEIKRIMASSLASIVTRLGGFFMPAIKAGFRKANRPMPTILRVYDPTTIALKAWRSYVPKPYAKSVVFFRVQDRGPEHDRDPSMGWKACVTGGVELHIVPGTHTDMMRMPNVRVIADTLATCLDHGSKQNQSTRPS